MPRPTTSASSRRMNGLPSRAHASCSDARLSSAGSRPSARKKLAVEAITKSAAAIVSAIPDTGIQRSSIPTAGGLGDVVGKLGADVERARALYEQAALTASASSALADGTTTESAPSARATAAVIGVSFASAEAMRTRR